MTAVKPYLIRAFYDWIVDNSLTPYVLVDADQEGVFVPRQFVKDGRIIFNIAPIAVDGLMLSNPIIEFDARFSGKLMHVVIPVTAVMAIYAYENGQGMSFDSQEESDDGGDLDKPTPPSPKVSPKTGTKKRPNLTVVK